MRDSTLIVLSFMAFRDVSSWASCFAVVLKNKLSGMLGESFVFLMIEDSFFNAAGYDFCKGVFVFPSSIMVFLNSSFLFKKWDSNPISISIFSFPSFAGSDFIGLSAFSKRQLGVGVLLHGVALFFVVLDSAGLA